MFVRDFTDYYGTRFCGNGWRIVEFGLFKRKSVIVLKSSDDEATCKWGTTFGDNASINMAEAFLNSPNALAGLCLAQATTLFRVRNGELRREIQGRTDGIG